MVVRLRNVARFFVCLFALLAALPPASAQTRRPLIIIVPGSQQSVSGVASTDQADGETLAMRAQRAAGKVRDYLNDSQQVEATLYAPDAPLFVRAALEAHLKPTSRFQMSTEELVALAHAAGAIYIATVGIQRAADGGTSYEMLLQGVDTESKKTYSDRAKYLIVPSSNRRGDADAIVSGGGSTPANALNSAANTLVTRLLNGPLAAYGRVAPVPVLDSAKPGDAPVTPAASTEADLIDATIQQANTLLADGDPSGAIVLLRRTINQTPANLKLRLLLARGYLAAHRNNDATAEIKRAFLVTAPTEIERKEATGLLSESLKQSGNPLAARSVYEEIIAAQPDAIWAHLALADQLRDVKPDVAETHYRVVLEANATNSEAVTGLARILARRGDFNAALDTLLPKGQSATPQSRATAAAGLFDEFSVLSASALKQSRSAWLAKEINRETLYKSTVAQVSQINGMVTLLKANPPIERDDKTKRQYGHRLLAASLLAQAATALQNYVENGDKESGAQATLWLAEFQKELTAARSGDKQ